MLLNMQFIEECYEAYFRTILNSKQADLRSQTLAQAVAENHTLIEAIEEKVRSIEKNYRINFGIKALKYCNLGSLKQLAAKN